MDGLALLILLLTTIVAALIAVYYIVRFDAVQEKLFDSDELATSRSYEIQLLQMKIEVLKMHAKKGRIR